MYTIYQHTENKGQFFILTTLGVKAILSILHNEKRSLIWYFPEGDINYAEYKLIRLSKLVEIVYNNKHLKQGELFPTENKQFNI